jgi:hypothetical protein
VFLRGILSPILQFGGGSADAIRVEITSPTMSYVGYFGASTPANAQLPAKSWAAVTAQAGAADHVTASVTRLSMGVVEGPIKETWSVAQGSIRGRIYYETYNSAIIGGAAAMGIGIMSLTAGAATPTPIATGCGNVCHTASGDGSTLLSNGGSGAAFLQSVSYDLHAPVSVRYRDPTQAFTYGGTYPDGTFAMSATNYRTWLTGHDSHLYDTSTGAQIPAPGWDGVYTLGGTTAFSPDGTLFAFNGNDQDDGAGHTLDLASFTLATHTFSNVAQLAYDASHTLAWPTFTPDSASVLYHAGLGAAYDGGVGSGYETDLGATGNIYRTDVASQTAVRLDALDGYSPTGASYLPANDPDLSFAPNVLPEAIGGYFWVVFTSHRSYGNILASQDNGDVNGKLWIAALDMSVTPGADSSHPAFYLDGQELVSDNPRGCWVPAPCQANAAACGAGDECCSGFCRASAGGAMACVAAPSGCANEFERCGATSDCCGKSAGVTCIGGYCAAPAP